MQTIHYVNLTNGIEFLPELKNVRFIRIKSTHLERHLLEDVLLGLSDDLLMNLAIGNKCVICDFGMYFDVPRSIWEGIPWIKYVLNMLWFNREDDYFITRWRHRGKYIPNEIILKEDSHPKNYKVFFRNRLERVDKRIIERILYYKTFLKSDTINIVGLSRKTNNDGDVDFYKKTLGEYFENINII